MFQYLLPDLQLLQPLEQGCRRWVFQYTLKLNGGDVYQHISCCFAA